jgi:hypothetical protein
MVSTDRLAAMTSRVTTGQVPGLRQSIKAEESVKISFELP